ncbi:MAG: RNA polymerase sigma factor [Fibrobacteria bacterium]|nr:RNA polymerase sigma factor [Fibrobacteria bacterium]
MNPSSSPGNQRIEPSDEDLAKLAATGDERAFFQLYDRHRRYILTLVVRTTGRRDDADDVVQECFFQMHRALPSFSGRSSFRTWLHSISVRVCHSSTRNRLAQRRRGDAEATSLDDQLVEQDLGSDGRDEEHLYSLRDWIQNCMDRMSALHRVPLVLHLLGELEITDISRILGIPEGSVKSRLFHARKRMATCLEASER